VSTSPDATDTERCPVCSGANDCGLARGASTCWCFDATLAPAALAAIPEAARGRVCICRGCAGVSELPTESARRAK
jgi:hypothetical protein